MTTIIQSGNVTPGHLATWTTDGVLQDGGPTPATETVIAGLLSANFNTTIDQAIAIPSSLSKWLLTRIIVTNASVALNTAAGGFYPQSSKGGTAIVAAGQTYTALTATSLFMQPTLSSYALNNVMTNVFLNTFAIYLSLTTPQGVAATADVYVCGIPLR